MMRCPGALILSLALAGLQLAAAQNAVTDCALISSDLGTEAIDPTIGEKRRQQDPCLRILSLAAHCDPHYYSENSSVVKFAREICGFCTVVYT